MNTLGWILVVQIVWFVAWLFYYEAESKHRREVQTLLSAIQDIQGKLAGGLEEVYWKWEQLKEESEGD